jgi:hypothetical protein
MGFIQIVVMGQVAQPDLCEEQHLQFAWQGTLQQCIFSAHRAMDRRSSGMGRKKLPLRIPERAAQGVKPRWRACRRN